MILFTTIEGEAYIMVITDVRVRKIYPTGKMRGIVSVTFDDEFVVHDIKVNIRSA